MSYFKYKEKLIRGFAIAMAAMLLVGTFAPVVFAEENEDTQQTEESQDQESEEEESPEETALPVKVIGIYPKSANKEDWFNEETLHHDLWDSNTRNRFFLKVTFDNTGNNLSFDSLNGLIKLRDFTTVYSDSSNVSMVDIGFLNEIDGMETEEKKAFIDKYIFRKATNNRAYLYIPIRPLMSHMTYSVTLSQGIVFNNHEVGNDSIAWNFHTMAIPSLAEKDVIVQSVIEDYSVNDPIIIYGKFFYEDNVEVYFNDERAYRVRHIEDGEGNEYLEVYLPRGRNKLDPGLYDITIENSYDHSKQLYGALSVVPEADRRILEEKNIYSNRKNYGDVVGARRATVIRLDAAEPIKEYILRSQLKAYTLKSPIVEMEAIGFSLYRSFLEIPVDGGIYENYKVLRYDEQTRIWTEEEDYSIDKVDQMASVTTFNSGIFVVVESKY